MTLFLLMNASGSTFAKCTRRFSHFIKAGSFQLANSLIFNGMSNELVMLLTEVFWWLHIVGILIFMNYLYISKHLHILLTFPNTYADLNPLGEFDNLAAVTKEVKMMMDLMLILSPLNTATEGVEVLSLERVMFRFKLGAIA
jgi:hypothetical protein